MRSKELNWRRMLNSILLATVMIVFTGMYFYIDANAETTRIGTVVVDTSLNFRNGSGTEYDIIGTLYNGDKGTIIGEDKDSNGTVWYNMVVDGTNGWASSAYIKVTEQTITNDDFESYLEEQGFPESYKAQLRALHELYPEWEFEAQITGLDWNDVIAAESELGVNLVAGTSPSSWKSTQEGAYDWETGEWVEYDSGGWVAASEEIIKFYMDPRNFLDSTYVFQFLKQSYDESTMTSDEIQKKVDGLNVMVDGTYLAGDCEGSTYVDVLMNAARTYGVCPYTIASTLIQEQGRDGSGRSISGTVEGYEGYYNYYNIGAYAEGDLTAVERGLLYAKGGSDGSGTSYGRPWDTRVKSINGGTEYYGASYIKKGQDTIYLKKFNVQGSSPYTHQYMTNVQAAASEGSHIADAYPEGSRNARLSFKIPVFENMPESACVKPTGDGSPNYMLKSLSVSGYDLSPEFDMYTTEYTVTVARESDSVTVFAKACDTNATISGAGDIILDADSTVVDVIVEAENGDRRVYTITIVKGDVEEPEVPEEPEEPDEPEEPAKPTLEDCAVPTTLTVGKAFSVKGVIKSEETLTNVSVACVDVDGNVMTGSEASPNTTRYDIGKLDAYIEFNKLKPGMYYYRITATTDSGTTTLLDEPFTVLAVEETIIEDTYLIVPYLDHTFALHIKDNSNESGANVELYTKEDSNYQAMKAVYAGDGYYTLQFVESEMLLTAGGSESGSNVYQASGDGTDSQKWQILPVGDSYCFVPKHATDLCLNIQDSNLADGVNIEIAARSIADTQRFSIENIEQEKGETIILSSPTITSVYSKAQNYVKVTWTEVENAEGYELFRAIDPDAVGETTEIDEADGKWFRAKTITSGDTVQYTNHGLTVGQTYYYKVRAFITDEQGNRVYSEFSDVNYMPAAVVFDKIYSNATFRVRILWNEVKGAHGYQIWRLNEDGTWSIVKTLGDKGNELTNNQGTATSYSNTGLEAGKTYTYKMRAFSIINGKKVYGAYSDEYTVVTKPDTPVVTGSSEKAGRATLKWEAVNGAAGYQIWMSESDTGDYTIVKSITDNTTTSYTKYDLTSGKTYYFKVRVYAEVNSKKAFSEYSDMISIQVR